jgi:hypothetical protein
LGAFSSRIWLQIRILPVYLPTNFRITHQMPLNGLLFLFPLTQPEEISIQNKSLSPAAIDFPQPATAVSGRWR